MKTLNLFVTHFLSDESGQDLIEYGLVASFVALLAVAAFGTFADDVKSMFSTIGTHLTTDATTLPSGT
ncbi:MAG TPA: Flp family type IVb pilin [Granulicella sp.]